MVPSLQPYEGRVFQPYFIVPKKGGGLRPILGLRILMLKMLMQNPVFGCIRPQFVCSIDLKTRTSMCRSFRATGHSCGLRSKTSISVQVLPFGLSLSPPCLHESSGGSPCSLERTGRAHSQLPLDDWHTGSVSGSVMRTQGLVLSHLSQLGLRSTGKRANSCRCEDLFLGMEFGFGQSDSTPHAGTRSVGVELLEYVQEQDGGTKCVQLADLQRFGLVQVYLFASLETSLASLFYSLTEGTLGTDALAHSWPRGLRKYAFPPVSLLAQTLCKVREEEEQILLVAPYWPTRTWFPELMLLVTAPPWQIPLRKDLLTQRRGTLWHPHPDLWKLHVWSLDGTRRF